MDAGTKKKSRPLAEAIIPVEDIQTAVVEVDTRTQAEKDAAVLKEAYIIRQDPARLFAAKSIPGTPNF